MPNNIVVETVSEVPFGIVLAWVMGISALIIAGCVFLVKLYKLVEKYRKKRNKIEKEQEKTEHIEADTEEVKQDVRDLETAIRWMMADRINQKIKHYYRIDYIPQDEFTELSEMYHAYKGVGGNSTIDEKYHKCLDDLHVKPDALRASYTKEA